MGFLTLIGLSVALAMDAFAVALGVGVVLPRMTVRQVLRLSFHFGLFQALMPVIGWFAGLTVQKWISAYAPWVAFGLLALIGGKMIWEAFQEEKALREHRDPTRGLSLFLLSVATSIDALAVGLSLAMLEISVWFPALIIGLVAAAFTTAGMLLGKRIGSAWGPKVEVCGGLVLLAIGLKILLEEIL
ncbi:manganese efflux pump MntP [Geoalkalibacter halelectricus]|uniref:Putative manganese efflux pump MntP n=1 Tax=Geoalkalibacter halelectricus TaxID=2847045 RepID=A0ABY5ZPW3_9BACT|nr:manganese efflux pump MntP family protein [Geoalkalibacter halelectricus]MDO3376969.1 manganese efflux pump MntP family protein [Geoalkalibacter halelectricus]UWZ81192.1 manganese efflux pump MntP family protein [Geoalkalibacter halelectricus]